MSFSSFYCTLRYIKKKTMAICTLLRILVRPLRRFNATTEMFRPLNILTNQDTLKNLDRGSPLV
jgi:hypothetical protein